MFLYLHLKVTEKTEKPIEEVIPKISPNKEFFSVLPKAIIIIPTVAINIATQTFNEIFSFKNKKPSKAVKKGMAAKTKQSNCSTSICNGVNKEIIAIPSPEPPMNLKYQF